MYFLSFVRQIECICTEKERKGIRFITSPGVVSLMVSSLLNGQLSN